MDGRLPVEHVVVFGSCAAVLHGGGLKLSKLLQKRKNALSWMNFLNTESNVNLPHLGKPLQCAHGKDECEIKFRKPPTYFYSQESVQRRPAGTTALDWTLVDVAASRQSTACISLPFHSNHVKNMRCYHGYSLCQSKQNKLSETKTAKGTACQTACTWKPPVLLQTRTPTTRPHRLAHLDGTIRSSTSSLPRSFTWHTCLSTPGQSC